ncbi:MAG: hypothetical protein ACRCW2_04890 [Cellulosilyticaceae bacterium]
MAVTAKHKKARAFRDFLIATNGMNMFREDEIEDAIAFRSLYPLNENDKIQFMIIINDSIYTTMQSLVVSDVPTEKRAAMLELINQIHLEYPTVKYVLTADGQVMTSMSFHSGPENLDSKMVMMCIIEFFKVVAGSHLDRFNGLLNA